MQLKNVVRVIRAEDDAEWKAEFEKYSYNTDMWVGKTVGDCDYEFKDNVETVDIQEHETYGFMYGCENDRRCWGFDIDVYTCTEGKHWITEKQFEEIG